MAKRKMDPKPASIWTIPAGLDFATTLVKGILERFGQDESDALALADITLLLPNRRAVRTVQTAFLRAFDARATLLPRLMVLGEEVDDSLDISSGLDGSAVAPMDRLALLSQLIDAWQTKTGTSLCATPAHQVQLAKTLARVLDQSLTEGLSFDDLDTLVPDDYAHHWQEVLTFLQIVTRNWPAILDARGQQDGAALRRQALERQAQTWLDMPPTSPVIAAGSTGSIPATAALLNVIAAMPQGHLVLPGLDTVMPEETWGHVTESHPQGALKRLLETLAVERAAVKPWRGEAVPTARARRLAMINAALSPAQAFGGSITEHAKSAPLPGLHLAEVDGDRAEASLIALLLRETLETPEKTAALITPDRQLARQVAAQLTRWGITIDDSAGLALKDTPPAQFMRLVAAAIAADFAPAPLLSLLKHPFFHCGQPRVDVLAQARTLDNMLRGPRRSGGLQLLIREARTKDVKSLLTALADTAAIWPQQNASMAQHLAHHMAAAQTLAQGPDGNQMFEGNDGNALALWCDDLIQMEHGFEAIAPEHYGALFDTLLDGAVVRTGIAKHPRLAILGTIEARMTHADVMVLGGLNDGTWPPAPAADPWMNEPMRIRFGLPPVQRRIGLSAHDFVQACGAPEVWLTRTTKKEGAPTLASRWIERLKAAYGARVTRGETHIAWAEAMDQPERYAPQPQPAPRPPLDIRPRTLSVSDIERWMRDPYALYAKRILNLEPLKVIDEPPGAADRGSAIHDALEQFFKDAKERWPANPHAALMAAGETAFAAWKDRPGVWALWWPRFADLADWILTQQRRLDAQGRHVAALEVSGKRAFSIKGKDWTVRAKADRIDIGPAGLTILDYKTGAVPSKKALTQGYAPQLPVEGLIAQGEGFDVSSSQVAGFEYWSLSTTTSGGPKRDARMNAEALMHAAQEGLTALFTAFSDPNTAYLHAPSPMHAPYKDYDDLSRAEEWRDVPEANKAP